MSMRHYPIMEYGVLISEADINEYAKSNSVDIETAKEFLADDLNVSYEGAFSGSVYEISETGRTVYEKEVQSYSDDAIYYFVAKQPTPFSHPYKNRQDMEEQMLTTIKDVFPFKEAVHVVCIFGTYFG